MVLCSSRMRWYGHEDHSKGYIAQVCKQNIVAQKRSSKPRQSWYEVLMDNTSYHVIRKLEMNTADPKNHSGEVV